MVQSAVGGLVITGRPEFGEPSSAGWFDRPMRWAQLAFVENDPAHFDMPFWLDYLKRTHVDAVCLSAGGCVAFYPTKVPLHFRSRWLGSRDLFGDMVAACRKMGLVVVARTDPHAVHQDVCDAHPDWIAVDANGEKRRHWASPEYWVACALGPYNFQFMTDVHKEIMSTYQVEAIFCNRWAGSGMCYCEHCAENFKKAFGRDLPRALDPQDLARRDYIIWRQQRLFELWRLWQDEIQRINPNSCFMANAGGGALSDLDMKTVGELASVLAADRQARNGTIPPWAAGKNGKEYRATLGRKPVAALFSVGLEEPYRWKDSVQSGAEIKLWAADGIANGMRPWFVKFCTLLHDRRWLKTVEEIFQWHYRAGRYMVNQRPLARVAVVYSQQTAAFYGGEKARSRVEDHTLGFYQALIEARIPFEMVHDQLLDPARVDQFKVLILPNIAALSDRQCAQIRSYVGRGGSLVATFETSLYDEWGHRRSDFGLKDLFGATFSGPLEGPMRNSYLKVNADSRGRFHPLVSGLEDAGRITNGVWRVPTVPANGGTQKSPLTLIPSYPDLPMEMVYPRDDDKEGGPEVYLRERGGSRVVYFPWDADRTFWEILCVDHGRLLANAVKWTANEVPPVEVIGPGVLDVTVWQQEGSITVHLVNLTNPMMMKGPVRELMPVGEQEVRLRLPDGYKPRRVHLLTAGHEVNASEMGGRLVVRVPSILLHEVVAVDL